MQLMSRWYLLVSVSLALSLPAAALSAAEPPALYEANFSDARYGSIPDGWQDLIQQRPSSNWVVDGRGLLRPVLKLQSGLLAYSGYTADVKPAHALADCRLVADFSKTADEAVSFGIAGRVVDRDNYYLARFRGVDRLELIKVKSGEETALDLVKPVGDLTPRPTGAITLDRYREQQRWSLTLELSGDLLTAVVQDAAGREQARLTASDGEFQRGKPGLCCTTFAAAASFRVEALAPFEAKATTERLAKRNAILTDSSRPRYPVVKPVWDIAQLHTPPEKVAADYDVVVAGAGTGGWAAAVQAARLGSRVLLLEETDWIGGQMCAAAVTSMDEDSVWHKFPVRERGIYREFHESMVTYYHTLDKDPQVAYFSYPQQLEGGYEPKAARAVLYGFIEEVRSRGAVLDLCLQARVTAVQKQANTVTGATVHFDGGNSPDKPVACKVLIDATEYGDVIPLTGAHYRVGNVTSDKLDPTSLVQDHTWTAVVREYAGGVPAHLRIEQPPPGYETGSGKRYRNYRNEGLSLWGGAGKGIKGPRHWRVFFAWRGMADADSPLTGLRSSQRHTQCGFNGGNDYPVMVATIEDPAQRRRDEREGIYKTLGALYYFQHELGVPWSLAEDEGYNTLYNRAKMKSLELRPDLEALAVHLPQQPYVRECRRIIGLGTLVAADLTRYADAKHMATSVAMGDYFMDLDHGKTGHAIEPDLDTGEPPRGGGPFQIPLEIFIPETLDGFLPAEKNISQSRLVNGATRLQPVTMLTGQAAGTIAALAVKQGVQPRVLKPSEVQQALLDSGSTLIQRWHSGVPWGTPLWRATQLLSLYQVLDRPGGIDQDNAVPLGSRAKWGVDEPLTQQDFQRAIERICELRGLQAKLSPEGDGSSVSKAELLSVLERFKLSLNATRDFQPFADPTKITAGEFALIAAEICLRTE